MSRNITIQNIESGVLTDAVSVVMEDPLAVYGIREKVGGAVVVAAGTAATRVSTGYYEFDISALDTAKVYEAYWKVTRSSGDVEYVAYEIEVVSDIPPSTTGKVYADVDYCSQYLSERLNTDAWDDATAVEKAKALIMATKMIDRLNFKGEKTDEAQTLQFPRYDDSEIPTDIKDANCELALALLDEVDPEIEFENLSMVSHGYANVRSTYDRSVPGQHIIAGIVSVSAWRLLMPYLRDMSSVNLSRVN